MSQTERNTQITEHSIRTVLSRVGPFRLPTQCPPLLYVASMIRFHILAVTAPRTLLQMPLAPKPYRLLRPKPRTHHTQRYRDHDVTWRAQGTPSRSHKRTPVALRVSCSKFKCRPASLPSLIFRIQWSCPPDQLSDSLSDSQTRVSDSSQVIMRPGG